MAKRGGADCGDTCIGSWKTECMCGGEIFNATALMWCCNEKPCVPRGEKKFNKQTNSSYWAGEEDKGGRTIGAECNGTALKLEEPCNQKCNDYKEDPNKNYGGIVRTHVACNVTNLKITQCIREDKYLDGKVDCRNRADEEIFQTSIGNTSSLLLDLEQILSPCKDRYGFQGFKCSESSTEEKGRGNCHFLAGWCDHIFAPKKCTELAGTTATGKTTDPQMCKNQTFWEKRSCNGDHRCTGDTPGQCLMPGFYGFPKCLDGSSDIKEAEDGHCDGEEVKCWARGPKNISEGREKVCIKDQYKCDGVLHCYKGEDETNCNQWSNTACEDSGDCDKAYNPPPRHCETEDDVMCTARDGKFAGRKICVQKKFQCDNHIQCDDGKDEEMCEEEYKKKRIFKRDHHYICKSPFLNIKNETDKFFPMRAIRFISLNLPPPFSSSLSVSL